LQFHTWKRRVFGRCAVQPLALVGARVTLGSEDSIEEELNYDEAFESYDSFVTENSASRYSHAAAS
jgi:hypothetical protein